MPSDNFPHESALADCETTWAEYLGGVGELRSENAQMRGGPEEVEREALEQLLAEAEGCGARWVAYERGLIRPTVELEAELAGVRR